ncbi:hypothetical protein [Tenacibaculum jejuense]|uniref:Uncharacterized protein n=1 Tax=Tenacibaculum jejuense TaxID=584609 RepID=A0A238U7V7_9FLAO|nr:hypothetical protein [Tenacibaculum jejuense]SNR15273.1 Probable transmembrane protein of unknown function; putative anti ECF-type sigma factor [Tenacibaculum jejuense]
MNQNKEHNDDFLNQKFGKNTGFNMPDNYFNDLENDLMSKLIVDDLPEKCGFEIPESYLDTLENKILDKTKDDTSNKTKVISLRKRIVKFTSYAAAASILIFISIQFINTNPSTEENIVTIDDWFENNDVTTDELALLFDDQDFSENDLSYTLENDSVEDYLDNIDNSSLLDEIQ